MAFATDSMNNRKFSTATVNTDSGISSINNDEGVYEENGNATTETNDCYQADDNSQDSPELKVRPRVSLDQSRNVIDLRRFMETTARSRRSCSLPDILDFDVEEIFHHEDTQSCSSSNFAQNDANSSSGSLSTLGSPDQIRKPESGNGGYEIKGNENVQLCGKEHKEKPCFICLKDNEIYCKVCVMVHNFHCKEKVKHIPEIPPEMKTNLCQNATKDLVVMKERFEKVKHENEKLQENLKESRKTFLRSVMKYKNRIVEVIDHMEKEALSQMDSIYNEEKDKLETSLENIEKEIASIESYITILEQSKSANENSVVYELQGAIEQARRDETLIRDLHKSTNTVQFEFEPLTDLLDRLTDFNQLWKIQRKETSMCTYPQPCTCDRSYRDKVAIKDREVSVRLFGLSFDRERCCITGCEFLPNGKLLVCDNSNKKVKLFDKKFKCVSAHGLHSLPWDVAVVNEMTAVVTIPDRKELQFMDVHHKICLRHSIILEQNCWGVSHSNEQLFVTCWSRDKTEVLVMDMKGTLKRRISTVQSLPFHTPWFLNASKETLSVSDWGTYVIQCVTTSGVAVSKYRSSSLVGPLGMTRDPDGNLYVCGRDSNNIHQISSDRSEQRIFLTEKDGLSQPLNICHRKTDDKLVVTSWMSDKISIFRLH